MSEGGGGSIDNARPVVKKPNWLSRRLADLFGLPTKWDVQQKLEAEGRRRVNAAQIDYDQTLATTTEEAQRRAKNKYGGNYVGDLYSEAQKSAHNVEQEEAILRKIRGKE